MRPKTGRVRKAVRQSPYILMYVDIADARKGYQGQPSLYVQGRGLEIIRVDQ